MKKFQGPLKGYYLFAQISSVWLCSVFGGLAAGLWLDRRFETAPFFLLLLLVLGVALAMYSIYQTIKQLK